MLIGVANKTKHLRRSWTLPNDSKHNEASFSTISTDMLYLQVAQTPRSPDLAIFVLTDDDRRRQTTTDKTDYFTPCACARGKNNQKQVQIPCGLSTLPLWYSEELFLACWAMFLPGHHWFKLRTVYRKLSYIN